MLELAPPPVYAPHAGERTTMPHSAPSSIEGLPCRYALSSELQTTGTDRLCLCGRRIPPSIDKASLRYRCCLLSITSLLGGFRRARCGLIDGKLKALPVR